MRHEPGQPEGDETLGDYEGIGLGRDSPDDAHPLQNLDLLEIDPSARTGFGDAGRPRTGALARRLGLAVILSFVLGLAAGLVAAHSPGDAAADAPLAVAAGPVAVAGDVVPLGPSAGVVPVSVRVHNSGASDVDVLSINVVAWHDSQGGSARLTVTVPAGQSRSIGTGVQLQCDQPNPPMASVVNLRLRTDALGVISLTRPLSEPLRALTRLRQEFCA